MSEENKALMVVALLDDMRTQLVITEHVHATITMRELIELICRIEREWPQLIDDRDE